MAMLIPDKETDAPDVPLTVKTNDSILGPRTESNLSNRIKSDGLSEDVDIGHSNQDTISSGIHSAYQSILKDEVENKPLDVSLPQVSKYIRINGALNTNDEEFPTTPDAELALRAKVPVRFAKQFPEEAERKARDRKQSRTQLSEATKNEIDANPESTRILRDDFENLDKFYKMLNYRQHIQGHTDDSFLDKIGVAWSAGSSTAKMAEYSDQVRDALSNGLDIPDDVSSKLNNLSFDASAGTRDGTLLSQMAVGTTRIAKPLIDSTVESIPGAVQGAGYGTGAGAALGSLVPGLGTVAGGVSGAALGARAGVLVGFSQSTYDQTYVPAAYSYSQMSVDGARLDPKIVNSAATMEAVISTGLDVVSFAVLGNLVGKAFNPTRQIISSSLRTPAGLAVIEKMNESILASSAIAAVDIGKATAAEASTEAIQEIVLDAFGELAKQWTSESRGGEYEAKDVLRPEVMDKAWDAAKEAAIATPLLAGAPMIIPPTVRATVKAFQHKSKIENELSEQEILDKSIESFNEMSSKNTEPGRRAFSETLKQQGMETTYLDLIDTKQVIEELKQDGKTPENSEWIGKIQEGVKKAEKEGSSVQIPTVEMISNLGEKGGDLFRDLMTMNEDNTAPNRSDEVNASIAENINTEMEVALEEHTRLKELSELTSSTLEKLESTGVLSSNASKMLSTLIPAWASTITKNSKLTPEQLIKDFGLKIEGAYNGLESKDFDGAKGNYNLRTKTINLGNDQDLSTFLHESAHFFFDVEQTIGDISRIEPILPVMSKDLNISEEDIRANFDDPNSNPDTYVKVQEYFARKFESYIMEGKAPSIELREEFRTWRQWMMFAYKDNDLGMKIDDASQAMFDSLLVAERMSEQLSDELMYNDIDAQQITSEVTQSKEKERNRPEPNAESQFDKIAKLFFKSLKRKQSKEYKKSVAQAKEQAESDVNENTIHRLVEAIKSSEDIKFDREVVKKLLGVKKVPNKFRNLTQKDGFSVADIIDLYDLPSHITPEKLVNEISNLIPKAQMIKERTNEIMATKVPDLSDSALMQQVVESLRSKDIADGLLKVLNSTLDDGGKKRQTKQAIRQSAIDAVHDMSVRDVISNPFHKREVKAAKEYTSAIAIDDKPRAEYNAKQRLLNFFMAKESSNIKRDFYTIRKQLSRYKSRKVQGRIDQYSKDLWDRMSIQLGRAGILNESFAKGQPIIPLKEMTVGQMYALDTSVKSIAMAAKNEKMVILGRESADLDTVVKNIVGEMNQYSSNIDLSVKVGDNKSPIVNMLRGLVSNTSITPWVIKTLSNPKGTEQSTMQMALDRPLVLAHEQNNKLWDEHVSPIIEQFMNNSKEFKEWMSSRHSVPSLADNKYINSNMKGEQILAFALNIGTQNNLQTLLAGYNIIEKDETASIENAVVQDVLSNMDKMQWDMVKSIWKQMDLLFPHVADVSVRHKGIKLKKEESISITLRNGKKIQGGYYPLFRDNTIQVESKDTRVDTADNATTTDKLFSGEKGANVSFNPSSTNDRTKATYPVLLQSGSSTINHFRSLIHYVTHYDAVDSINKIITHRDFSSTFQKVAGQNELESLNLWIKEVAHSSPEANQAKMDVILKHMRYGTTVVMLGGSVSTVLKQTLGFFNSISEIGEGIGARGAVRFIKALSVLSSKNSSLLISDMLKSSAVMSDRINHGSFDREVNELMNGLEGNNSNISKLNSAMMFPIRITQFYAVDTPTWLAARQVSYDNAMRDGKTDKQAEKISIAYADSLVERTQGSSGAKNMPMLLRQQRSEGIRNIVSFMSAMLAMMNQVVDIKRSYNRGNFSASESASRLFYNLVAPAMALTVARMMFTSDDDAEWGEELQKEVISSAVGVFPFGDSLKNAVQGNVKLPGTAEQILKGADASTRLLQQSYNSVFDTGEYDSDKFKKAVKGTVLFAAVMGKVGGANQVARSIDGLLGMKKWDHMTANEIAYELSFGQHRNNK
ncbi:hypothetical protein BJAS_P3427 [Bathymodiolus japonicus methanotrophic gill symbiont]|uniref:hypothetical protein n=1 Tax=Bathymodiolus japonicus methanotrophic gill symbiont TaxID=113269 RepID=UPI001B4FE093|nr:hypothetical protein [Bathymodiolus japonicus methanotrophic gill symbiont]GFO72891.1 hypothetical protein BJAS_P3427 [Bathymodiolus japonicus methanotrophic gill symbiont]